MQILVRTLTRVEELGLGGSGLLVYLLEDGDRSRPGPRGLGGRPEAGGRPVLSRRWRWGVVEIVVFDVVVLGGGQGCKARQRYLWTENQNC